MSKRAKPLLQDDGFTAKSKPKRKRDPAQPNLPFDPMPDRVEPFLALLKTALPIGLDWAFEIKWDGYRLAIHIEPKGVRIITRGGHDWTTVFPRLPRRPRNSASTQRSLTGRLSSSTLLDDPTSERYSGCLADAAANDPRRNPSC